MLRYHFSSLFALGLLFAAAVSAQQLSDYTLYANQNVNIGARVVIQNGLLGSKTHIDFGSEAQLAGNVVSMGNMTMQDRSNVVGDITLSGTLTRYNQTNVSGIITTQAVVDPMALPEKNVQPGATDFTVNDNQTATLQPGAYRNVSAGANATIHLRSGEYRFSTFLLSPDVTLYLDCSEGDILIDVLNDVQIADRNKLLITEGTFNPLNVTLYSHQTTPLRIGTNCRIEGSITVPRSTIELSSRTVLKGKLFANAITVQPDAKIEDCTTIDSDGDGMPDGWEIANGLDPQANDANGDLDTDGMDNLQEFICQTNPNLADSDGDGINDGPEFAYWSDRADTISWYHDLEKTQRSGGQTGDGLPNILDPDSDNDGIPDGEEIAGWTIEVNDADRVVFSDPAKIDSDLDGISDAEEFEGYDLILHHVPVHAMSDPQSTDSDSDGVNDAVELRYSSLNPAQAATLGYMNDRAWVNTMLHIGDWAVKPVSRHLDPSFSPTGTSTLEAEISFKDALASNGNADIAVDFCVYLEDGGKPITLLLDFIGQDDQNDRFHTIQYCTADGGEGAELTPLLSYTGPEANHIAWRIDDPAMIATGDYFFKFGVHYDKDAGEQPRTVKMYTRYDDGTLARIEYFCPEPVNDHHTSWNIALTVTGGTDPAFFRGETPVGDLSGNSYLDNIVLYDYWDNLVRHISRKAFNGSAFQWALGTLPTYTNTVTSCYKLVFDWEHDDNLPTRLVTHIDETADHWHNIEATYSAALRTKEYYCWSGGLSTTTPVVRRNSDVRMVVNDIVFQSKDAKVLIFKDYGGDDVTEQFDIAMEPGMDYPAYDNDRGNTWRENWIIHIPADIPCGSYSIEMSAGYWIYQTTIYVIFDPEQTGIDAQDLSAYCYDEDFDGTYLDYDTDLELDQYDFWHSDVDRKELTSYTRRVLDMAIATIDGETDVFAACEKVRMFTNLLVEGCWRLDYDWVPPAMMDCFNPNSMTSRSIEYFFAESGATIIEALAGVVEPEHLVKGQCMDFAALSVALSRSLGIPSRMAIGGGVDDFNEGPYIPDNTFQPNTYGEVWGFHVWNETWLAAPPDGDDHWYIFDATDYAGSEHGSSSSRYDFNSNWLSNYATVTVGGNTAGNTFIDVTDEYKQ